MIDFDVVIVGAGAAGMMCAIEAGKRGRRVLVIERNSVPGEKIRISGGGRCNFTNINAGRNTYVSANVKFALSALARYTPKDFIALIDQHGIAWHDKGEGQLFCDESAMDVVAMLREEMSHAGVTLRTGTEITGVRKTDEGFAIDTERGTVTAEALVIATGGKSIPKMGATAFGYHVAEQFGIPVTETRPALVPLTFDPVFLRTYGALSGVSLPAAVSCGKARFEADLLLTHRGLVRSGDPADLLVLARGPGDRNRPAAGARCACRFEGRQGGAGQARGGRRVERMDAASAGTE